MKKWMMRYLLILIMAWMPLSISLAIGERPPQGEANVTAGVVTVVGQYDYSDPGLPDYGIQPIVFLGDISNIFVEGAFEFSTEYLNLASPQVMADLTSDIRLGPLSYVIQLPVNPGGVLTDVDHDGIPETGVSIYTVNFTFNGIGDVFIDDREFIYYSSVTSSRALETLYQLNGGKIIVYAPEANQGFPSGYGPDQKLFTNDDPILVLEAGYTVVDITSEPFTLDRSSTATVDIVESAGEEFTDYSDLSYTEAFDAMLEMMRKEYAFTEYKGVDWDGLVAEFRPRFEQADRENDELEYARAFRDFTWSIPDGHIGSNALDLTTDDLVNAVLGGIGLAVRELDDGRVIVNYLLPNGPADEAGIQLQAEILELNGKPIGEAVNDTLSWFGPYSTEHNKRLHQLGFVMRFPMDTSVRIVYRNPNGSPQTETLTAIYEIDSLNFVFFETSLTGYEMPVEFTVLENGYGYIKVYSFSDDNLLTLAIWERAIRQFIANEVPGLIIDMRQNGGGSPDIGNIMLGYLFDEELYAGSEAHYFPDIDRFEIDPYQDRIIYPAAEADIYHGPVAVLISPDCASMCEFFSYTLTLQDRAAIVGQYPTAGLGGGIKEFAMPGGINAQFTIGRGIGANNEIHIEGKGVPPTVRVPVTEETLFSDGDPILEAAVDYLNGQ